MYTYKVTFKEFTKKNFNAKYWKSHWQHILKTERQKKMDTVTQKLFDQFTSNFAQTFLRHLMMEQCRDYLF